MTGNGVDKQLIQGPQKEMLSEWWHKGWEKDVRQSQSEEHSRRGKSQCKWTERERLDMEWKNDNDHYCKGYQYWLDYCVPNCDKQIISISHLRSNRLYRRRNWGLKRLSCRLRIMWVLGFISEIWTQVQHLDFKPLWVKPTFLEWKVCFLEARWTPEKLSEVTKDGAESDQGEMKSICIGPASFALQSISYS